jgi:uncharacterized integral membrane protein (TIGR00698 family)
VARAVRRPLASQLPEVAPGLLAVLAIAAVSVVIGAVQRGVLGHVLIEPLVAALLIGVVVRNAYPAGSDSLSPGASFAAKQVLEVAIVVLGMTLDFGQVLAAGVVLIWLIVAVVVSAIAVSFLMGRAIGLSPRLAFLVAVGNAICGNSAIAAVAPVIGAAKEEVASAIALTAVIGVCLVLGLPLLIPLLTLDHYQYGVVAGMSVYAVPQVVAASFPVSQLSGQVATLVKLIRVLLLGPVVLGVALATRRRTPTSVQGRGWQGYIPWFVAGFMILAVARSLGVLPDPIANVARDTSGQLMTIAMAGLGYGVRLSDMRAVGPRVAVAVVASLAFIATATVLLVTLLGIGT